jgi:beta-lactamase regulating signal transducer with metallopeptidase domain
MVVFKYFLLINLILGLSFLLFRGIRVASRILGLSISYLVLNRIAQRLILASIALPILLSQVPKERLPNLGITIRAPLMETLSTSPISSHSRNPEFKPSRSNPHSFPIKERIEFDFNEMIAILFLLGCFGLIGRLLVKIIELRRLLNGAILIRKIGQVKIFVSEAIKVPFSTLIGSGASIVLPLQVLGHPQNLRMIVNHEIHHHRNGDTFWILWMELAYCVFYLNPFFYLWKKEGIEIQEFACDEALIGQKGVSMFDYGVCLLQIAESARGTSSMQVGTTCMGGGPGGSDELKSFLRRRIEVFQDHKKPSANLVFGRFLGTLALVITASVAYGAQVSLRQEAKPTANRGDATFDPKIQKITERILERYIHQFGAKGGFVLVGDPRNGRLLAVANHIVGSKKQSTSWALSYQLEPASAMKGIVVASAIEKNLIQPEEKLNCEQGSYSYGGHTYRDWKAFGTITASEAVGVSSNICGIKIGQRLGAKGLEDTLKAFGFGASGTTANFPGARAGRYPQIEDLNESDFIPLISTGYTSIPGFYVTPLELLQAYGAIANGGRLMKPLSYSEADSSGTVLKRVISMESAQSVISILSNAVRNGTGTNAQSLIYTTAGKTSTAYRPESPQHPTLGGERGIAGFIGFAPAKEARLVVYVGMIDPTNSKDGNPHGNEHAAPVFKEVIETILKLYEVPSDIQAVHNVQNLHNSR